MVWQCDRLCVSKKWIMVACKPKQGLPVVGNDGEEVGCPWSFGAAVMHGGVEELIGLLWVV